MFERGDSVNGTYDLSCDDMLLFSLVEMSNTFDTEIVGLCSARGENDFFGVGSNEFGNVLYDRVKIQVSNIKCAISLSLPHELLQRLSHFPIHTDEFGNGGCRTSRSCRAT